MTGGSNATSLFYGRLSKRGTRDRQSMRGSARYPQNGFIQFIHVTPYFRHKAMACIDFENTSKVRKTRTQKANRRIKDVFVIFWRDRTADMASH